MHSGLVISAIVATAKNRVIGDGHSLLWKISEDFRRLKDITMGCPLIMGRKTWDSLGRPLPGRANIVLTRKTNWLEEGAIKASSIEEALELAKNWLNHFGATKKEIFIFGGMEVYKVGIHFCNFIYLTEVDVKPLSKFKFPKIDKDEWKIISKSEQKISEDDIKYKFITYQRVK